MFKKVFVALSLFFIFPTLVGAFFIKVFLDEKEFPAWAKNSISHMSSLGIIRGYEDNSFKPTQYVTRAELATILDRAEELKVLQLEKYSFMKSALEKIEGDESMKMAIALSAADFKILAKKPYVLKSGDCDEKVSLKIYGYEIYKCSILLDFYYVHYHYDGFLPESGGAAVIVDKWFGPFYSSSYNFGFLGVAAGGNFSQ